MSYHFLCKRGIRPARTEQFLVVHGFKHGYMILSSGGVHVSLLAVSATERVRLVVTLILCRKKSFINEFGGLSLVESIADLSASSQ